MKPGNKIRVQHYIMGIGAYTEDYVIEEFRFCLGFFFSEDHRRANNFTPLCKLYERGANSEDSYISNYGEYYTNPVQAWMDIP